MHKAQDNKQSLFTDRPTQSNITTLHAENNCQESRDAAKCYQKISSSSILAEPGSHHIFGMSKHGRQLEIRSPHTPIQVRWERVGFQVMPRWASEPRIESILEVLREVVSPIKDYKVDHLWDGTYNKFYAVEYDDTRYVLKVTLPVCPRIKTESEVFTMQWTWANTRLTLPKVISYSSSAKNAIGCEWILMTRLEGSPLSSRWRDLPIVFKIRIVMALADYAYHVYQKQFQGIGNLYPSALRHSKRQGQVGRLASMPFFWNGRFETEQNCGPFMTMREWACRRMNMAHEDLRSYLPTDQTLVDRSLVWRMLSMGGVLSKLWTLHDRLFPLAIVLQREERDSSGGNERCAAEEGSVGICSHAAVAESASSAASRSIQLSKSGELCDVDSQVDHAVLQAKQVLSHANEIDTHDETYTASTSYQSSTKLGPADDWAPAYPALEDHIGRGHPAEANPVATMLWHDNISADNIMMDESGNMTGVLGWDAVSTTPTALACDLPSFLNEGRHRAREPEVRHYVDYERRSLKKNYWRAFREYELTQLRVLFLEEMKAKCPAWYDTWRHSGPTRDFEAAVQNCDNEFTIGMVEDWHEETVKALDGGKEPGPPCVASLASRISEGPDWTLWNDVQSQLD